MDRALLFELSGIYARLHDLSRSELWVSAREELPPEERVAIRLMLRDIQRTASYLEFDLGEDPNYGAQR